ncbi:MAG: hypothetical protein LBJ72_09795 [Dysgonamonadaceae bacterium]|nr:hypothetical protein [Dysgonamonadaceae bacterium]
MDCNIRRHAGVYHNAIGGCTATGNDIITVGRNSKCRAVPGIAGTVAAYGTDVDVFGSEYAYAA